MDGARTTRTIRTGVLWAAVAIALSVRLSAQAPPQTGQYDRAQVAAGGILYGQWLACHGPNGDQIPNVDLRRGQFPTVVSDADLVRLLATGKPASGMPSFPMLRTDEVTALIAYIRSGFDAMGAAMKIGDPAGGRRR